MYVWEWRLKVRRAACEFRLEQYRTRHSEVVDERSRSPFMGPAWQKKDDKLAMLRRWIRRELDEIAHVKRLAMVGPIKGGTLVLHVKDGKYHRVMPGPSIIDLITRESDKLREDAESKIDGSIDQSKLNMKADGLELALEILSNPYRFLDDTERAAYNEAESHADKITSERGEKLARATSDSVAIKPAPSIEDLRRQGARIVRR